MTDALGRRPGVRLTKPTPPPTPPCPFEDGRQHVVTWRAAAFGPGFEVAEYLDCQTCLRVILLWRGVLETELGKDVPERFWPEALRRRSGWRDRRSAARRRAHPEPMNLFVDLRRRSGDDV